MAAAPQLTGRVLMSLLTDTIARIAPPDATAIEAARARQIQLTKLASSLGRLEELSIQIAGITGQARPQPRGHT